MRRITLLSTPANRRKGRQRTLFARKERPLNHRSNRSVASDEVRSMPPTLSLSKGVIKERSLTRTRSESDLIRAIAKDKEDKSRRRSSNDWDDNSSTGSLEEDDSRRATSLRSFTKEDEERYARSCREDEFHQGELCSKIGEEEEGTDHAPESGARESSSLDSTTESAVPPDSQSNNSPLSGSDDGPEPAASQCQAASSSTVPQTKDDEETKNSRGSNSGESTSVTMVDSEIDAEYLLHENELLKSSLEDVVLQRDSLARDNWNLRIELENMRNQMHFMMSAAASPAMYARASPSVYPNSGVYHGLYSYDADQGPERRAFCTSQTFEELLGE